MRPYRAVLIAILELVAVAERHALGRQKRAQEWRDGKDLVAHELKQPADLPLGHRAQAQAGHVDERPQVGRHHEVRPGGIGEDEPGILARDARLQHLAVEPKGAIDLFFVSPTQIRIALRDRMRQHRGGALELDVALALLIEGDARSMTDELMRERSRHAGDREGEDDMLDGRAVAGFDHGRDEFLHLCRVVAAVHGLGEDLLRDLLRVARAAGGIDDRHVELLYDVTVREEQRNLHPEVPPPGVLGDAGLVARRQRGAGRVGGTRYRGHRATSLSAPATTDHDWQPAWPLPARPSVARGSSGRAEIPAMAGGVGVRHREARLYRHRSCDEQPDGLELAQRVEVEFKQFAREIESLPRTIGLCRAASVNRQVTRPSGGSSPVLPPVNAGALPSPSASGRPAREGWPRRRLRGQRRPPRNPRWRGPGTRSPPRR